jgi:hypothetical protein
MIRRGRQGLGILLILFGVAGMTGGLQPVNTGEAIGFYGFGLGAILAGLWLVFRRSKPA